LRLLRRGVADVDPDDAGVGAGEQPGAARQRDGQREPLRQRFIAAQPTDAEARTERAGSQADDLGFSRPGIERIAWHR
jgi:hypothetical protein